MTRKHYPLPDMPAWEPEQDDGAAFWRGIGWALFLSAILIGLAFWAGYGLIG